MLQAVAVEPPSIDAIINLPAPSGTSAPASIRKAAADLVGLNQLSEALLLLERGLLQHPESQDLLAMMALVCEVRHDWSNAEIALEKLANVQGALATAETWSHWVRVVRCQGKLEKAFRLAQQGLGQHPEHELLYSEYQTLDSILHTPLAVSKG